jgi:hypothetical protein
VKLELLEASLSMSSDRRDQLRTFWATITCKRCAPERTWLLAESLRMKGRFASVQALYFLPKCSTCHQTFKIEASFTGSHPSLMLCATGPELSRKFELAV